MSAESFISALQQHGVRPVGRDRYRAICPACGERNANTLSIGVTAEGAVLLKCFKLGCDVETICGALGMDVADLFPPREQHAGPAKRRNLITDRQALTLLHDEAQLVGLCAANLRNGITLTENELDRLLIAAGRIAYLRDEVLA